MSNNENNLKNKNIRRNVLIISIIVFLSIIAVFVGYSKFTSTKSSEISVSLAGWNFKIDGKEHNSGNIQFEMSRTDTNNSVAAGKIAPGTSGELPIFVDVAGTDTALEYTIDFSITNKPTNLKFYGKRTGEGTVESPYKYDHEIAVKDISQTESEKLGKFVIKGYMSLAQVQEYNDLGSQRNETIYWDWPYEYDTLVKASQHVGSGTQDDIDIATNAKIAINRYDGIDTADVERTPVTISIKAKGTQALKEPTMSIKLANGWIVPLTEENAANYYGAEVNVGEGSSNTYRLFYVDFANDYNDGPGTIYLKADWKANDIKLSQKIESYNLNTANNEKFINMNPQWANYPTDAEEVDKNKNKLINNYVSNEKGSLWLSDPNVIDWQIYKNEVINKYGDDQVNYAIGSPSVELYIDSYNASQGYDYLDSQVNSNGYKYKISGGSWYRMTDPYTINTYRNGMYSSTERSSKKWWFASPSAAGNSYMCYISMVHLRLGDYHYTYVYGVCPVVSLKSDTFLELK